MFYDVYVAMMVNFSQYGFYSAVIYGVVMWFLTAFMIRRHSPLVCNLSQVPVPNSSKAPWLACYIILAHIAMPQERLACQDNEDKDLSLRQHGKQYCTMRARRPSALKVH